MRTTTTTEDAAEGTLTPPIEQPKGQLQRRVALASVTIPAIGFVVAVVLAFQNGIGWLEIGLLAGMYLVTAIGVEVGFHRFFSHHAFRAGPAVTAALGILGSMGAQGPVLFWAAIHRKHHVFTDKPGDPHSPRLHGTGLVNSLRGLWHAHVGWLFVVDDANWNRYVPDLLRDRMVFKINQYYFVWLLLGLAIPAAIGGAVTGTWEGAGLGFLWGGLVRIFLVDQATWSVNSIGHMIGRRPHATGAKSGNIALLSVFTVGGGWHNNHHAFPARARNDQSFWQIDAGGLFIELLAALGLAWDVRRTGGNRKPN